MGCSASRPETLISSNTIDPLTTPNNNNNTTKSPKLPVPRTISLVHHPPVKKGDTNHLVSLTSTTYGSLLLIDDFKSKNPKNPNPVSSNAPSNELPSPDSVINTWELMAGLDEDFDHSEPPPHPKPKPASGFVFDDRRCFSFDSANGGSKKSSNSGNVKNLRDSCQSMKYYQHVEDGDEDVSVENSATKPLWQHLSEELILADMDPNVVSSFRKAESSRKSGLSQCKKSTFSVSDARVSPLIDDKIQLPDTAEEEIKLPGTENKIVIYFTSLRGIRRTYEDCGIVRTIFKGLRVPVDERDISMDSSYRKELQTALDKISVSLPQVFIRGRHLGGVEEVKQLHEDGELVKLVQGFPVHDPAFVCENCGDARFVPCSNCNGSRKLFSEEEGQLKRCSDCNENGLIRCPSCCS